MKNFSMFLSLMLVILVASSAFSQLSKDEKKEWKRRAKDMSKNPVELKTLIESEQELRSEVANAKSQQEALEAQLEEKDGKIQRLQDDIQKKSAQLTEMKTKMEEMPATMAQEEQAGMPGVVFKVQIGAFRNKDLSKYFDNNPNFAGEMKDGTQKITLGNFSDYWEADSFKKYLREMGVKDAWIVPYKDGSRVPIKDVLEGVIN